MKKYLPAWLFVLPALIVAITTATVTTYYRESPVGWLIGVALIVATTFIEVRVTRHLTDRLSDGDAPGPL